MHKLLVASLCILMVNMVTHAQSPPKKMLFVIDSIPILTDPEDWNQVEEDDIADYTVITSKDSLKMLGWEEMDGVTYIFTKAYRNRPDSIRKIPGLKQMVMKNNTWYLHNKIYTGRYIDYYNNGNIQSEAVLLDGKLNGELTVYYRNGIKKSVAHYKDGERHGLWIDYYKNGALMQRREFVNDLDNRTGKLYFINGKIKQELRLKDRTRYDSSVIYHSTGAVKQMAITATGSFHPDRKEADLNQHSTLFYQELRNGDLKAANRTFYHIWKIDSASIDSYFKEGLLLYSEFRFDEAILRFDRALAIEPLMREALEFRAISVVKKYRYMHHKTFLNERKDIPVTVEDFLEIPAAEQAKVCSDLQLADDTDPGVSYGQKKVSDPILQYCRKR